MRSPKGGIDRILKESLGDSTMSAEENGAVWSRVEESLTESTTPEISTSTPERPVRSHRFRLVLVAAAAVVLVTVIALAPWNGSDENGSVSFTYLSTASASDVLNLTAESAVEQPSLVPEAGQVLYFRILNTTDVSQFSTGVPAEESGRKPETAVIEEWIGPDGKGIRLDGQSGSASMSDGVVEVSPLELEVDASRKIDQKMTVASSWRSQFTLEQVHAIPEDPVAALAYVQRIVEQRVRSGAGTTFHEAGIVGVDFLALATISNLLMEAPLNSEQRSTLFEVLGQAPDWYRSEGTAEIQVANKGVVATRQGREGILIEADLRLNAIESAIVGSGRRNMRYGVLLDPESGSVLETQVGFGRGQSPAVWNTSEALELRNRSAMPQG